MLSQLGGRAGRNDPSATDHKCDLYIHGAFFSQALPHYQERNSHRDHASTMHDSSALVRLILAAIDRPLVFVISAFIRVSATYVLYILTPRRISAYRSPLRGVPGPEGARWLKGNFIEVQETDSTRLQEECVRKYGHILKYQSRLWVRFPFKSLAALNMNRLTLCGHRDYWPWTLSRSPMFYKIATFLKIRILTFQSRFFHW